MAAEAPFALQAAAISGVHLAAMAAEQVPLLLAVTAVLAEDLLALVVLSVHANTAIDAQVAATTANRTTGTLRFTRHLPESQSIISRSWGREATRMVSAATQKACHPTHSGVSHKCKNDQLVADWTAWKGQARKLVDAFRRAP